MTPKVDNAGSVNNTVQNQSKRPEQYTVKQGDNINTLAKKFGMTVNQFQALTGVKTLKAGSVIKFKMDEVPAHKGIMALAAKYNMDFTEFCKLNNIPQPCKQYLVANGEKFYVIKNLGKKQTASANAPAKSASANKTHKSTPKTSTSKASTPKTSVRPQSAIEVRKKKWGSTFTPDEIASKLKKEAGDHWGAVEEAEFQAMLKEINPKNASAVIKAYDKLDTGESLINMITSEIRSKETNRKNAVMHVYDALAKEKGISGSVRTQFKANLDKEFDKWFGMVNTDKMDGIINDIISGKIKSSKTSSSGRTSSSSVTSDKTKITTSSGKSFTASELQKGAVAAGKREAKEKFKAYCQANGIKYDEKLLDLAPIERYPKPVVNGSKIVSAESDVLRPTTKPNGKVVILNPGHGGYSSKSGCFDPGSYSFILKGNGKYAPLLEYDKMKEYANDLSEKLRAQGYTVVIAGGHAETMSEQQSISKLVEKLASGQKGGKKYSRSDIAMISLHADSQPGSSGSGVCYDPRFADDKKLSTVLTKNLNEDSWIKAAQSERQWGKKGIQVLHQTEQNPSVLLEVEYVNGDRSPNLDSRDYRLRFERKVIEGLNEYFNLK